jgi:molybdenum cofactor cytidylyltransferase
MGSHKLLLPWRGRAMIADVVQRARAAATDVVVVTGRDAAATADALAGLDVQLVHNPNYAVGEMISSVKAGVAALSRGPRTCAAFFLVLGDQPGVAAETFTRLIDAWRDNPHARVISPTWNHRRGHPVLFAAAGIDEILDLPPDATLKTYVARHADASIEVEVDDPAVCADVDTPEQYERLVTADIGSPTCPTEATTVAAAV